MKKAGLVLIAYFLFTSAFSQSKTKWSLGVSVNPMYTSCARSTPTPGAGNAIFLNNDSVKTKDASRTSLFNITGWFNYSLGKTLDLQVGAGYLDVGFSRVQNDVQFHDRVFAGLSSSGTLEELSGGNGTKTARYDYRFQYLQLPVLINYRVKQSRDFRISYALSGGIAVDVLMKHKITANFENFTMNGEGSIDLSETGYEGSAASANIIIGARMDYKMDKDLTLMVQPVAGFFPFSATSSPGSVYPYYFALNLGLVFELAR